MGGMDGPERKFHRRVRSEEELIQKDENPGEKEKKVPRNPPIHRS